MNPCRQIDSYLDGRLKDTTARRFEDHLPGCDDCRRDVKAWHRIRPTLTDGTDVPRTTPPTTDEVLRMIYSAELLKSRGSKITIRRPILVAAAFFLVVTVAATLLLWSPSQRKTAPLSSTPVATVRLIGPGAKESSTVIHQLDEPFESPMDKVAEIMLGQDRITLARSSRIRFVELESASTEIRLERGTVTCTINRRKPGKHFSVSSDEYLVRVVGTRFTVEKRGTSLLSVTVEAGIVDVSNRKGERWRLKGGQSLRLPVPEQPQPEREDETLIQAAAEMEQHRKNTHEIKKTPAESQAQKHTIDELHQWRTWIIEGHVEEARQALGKYVAQNPEATNAWSLLADAHRKAGAWRDAVDAYQRVIARAPEQDARRARFLAGIVLQDNLASYAAAALMYENYLEQKLGKSQLRATAMVRLAMCYVQLDKIDQAKKTLETVVVTTPNNPAGKRAATLLETLRKEKSK